MTSEVVIRRTVPADIEAIAKLAGELVRQHHAVDSDRFFLPDRVEEGYAWWFRRELERDRAVLLTAERAGNVVGYSYGAVEDRDFNMLLDAHGAIHDVFVREGERGGGVGQRLVEAMLAELTARGAPRVVLSTMVKNEAAQRVFARCGFRPTMLEMTR
ncbi:MAG TPA: GNAT family N-acetyltransferase [Polyangiaceae bacterium]|nr:GNAT family N-acetyltransferase [Polyangiaceae bacterium]